MVVAAPLFQGILLSGLNIQAWMDLWAGSDFICRKISIDFSYVGDSNQELKIRDRCCLQSDVHWKANEYLEATYLSYVFIIL